MEEKPIPNNPIFYFEEHQFSYEIIGSGTGTTYLAFHGFGRTASDFRVLAPLLGEDRRIIAINLFHHEESAPKALANGQHFPLELWKRSLEVFLEKLEVNHFGLLGYSLGGRVALSTFALLPDRVSSMQLFAPDGFKVNKLYDFIFRSSAGKGIYHYFDRHPERFQKIVYGLGKMRILTPKLETFVLRHTENPERRKLVLDVWQTFRAFFPDLRAMGSLLKKHKPSFEIYFGEHDIIIPPSLGKTAKTLWKDDVHILTIPSGHSGVLRKSAESKDFKLLD